MVSSAFGIGRTRSLRAGGALFSEGGRRRGKEREKKKREKGEGRREKGEERGEGRGERQHQP